MYILFLELEGLVKFIRPFMLLVSKAKAAKMVRELLDLFLDMEVSTGTEVLWTVCDTNDKKLNDRYTVPVPVNG